MNGFDLKVERLRLGVRQWRVAAALGITQTSLSQIENGQRVVTPERLEEIVRTIRTLAGQPAGARDVVA